MKPISPQLLQKIQEPLQTIGNNANPNILTVVSRAKNSIQDADYWTVETIRAGSGLGDISIAPRRFKPNGRPNRLYSIHIQNGTIGTSLREYPDKLRQGWIPQFSLGSGSSIALAFNGHWERYKKFWRLITDEKPWIAWVDGAGVLWTQLWDDESTKFQLATNAVTIAMERAWKNPTIPENDQGIVVAYVKSDGKVYYRTYCVQNDFSEIWEVERALSDFTGVAVNLNLFITSDYRMGFTIQASDGKIHWLVSHRNWGGMASPAENIAANIVDTTITIIPILYQDIHHAENISSDIVDIKLNVCPIGLAPTIVGVERLSFTDKKTITLTFNYNLECDLVALKTTMTVKDAVNYSYTIDSISQSGKVLTIKTVEEMVFTKNIVVGYTAVGSYYLAYRISPVCLYDQESTINTTAAGIPPNGYASENLNFKIDSAVSIIQVYHKEGYTGIENLNFNITDMVCIITKVGSNPL